MTRRFLLVFCGLLLCVAGLSSRAIADTSHARIVRLSLVQGDVRFAPSFHEDPLSDERASWQAAPLNLPIRQGYVLATDQGRTEVEFENGAMIFLGNNSILEFYDLSLQDGARVTRLVLRQGTATVYVHPAGSDYFSLTGGDFTVEATERTRFRLDTFDDGSTVNVEQGHVNVLRDKKSTPLEKNQFLSMQATNSGDEVIGRTPSPDDFDRWVSGRIDSVVTATNYSQQYANSSGYTAGFGDLYTYGSWFSLDGYGYGWRPLGMGLGWSPFDYGSWYQDPFFGLTFIGSAPWGWLPYHYGAWIFSPVYGWVWVPTGFSGFGGPLRYRPVTAVWVRNGNSLGIVPLHPADKYGKTAQNLNQGIFFLQNSQIERSSIAPVGGKWLVLRQAPTEMQAPKAFAATTAPARISRTIVTSAPSGNRVVALSRDSSISYDPVEKRYVNSGNPTPAWQEDVRDKEALVEGRTGLNRDKAALPTETHVAVQAANKSQEPAKPGVASPPAPARTTNPPRPPATPAPAHTANGNSTRGSTSQGAPAWRSGANSTHGLSGGAGAHSSPGGGGHPH